MGRLVDRVRFDPYFLTPEQVRRYSKVLLYADAGASCLGLDLLSVDHHQYVSIHLDNRHRGWFPINDYFRHERFFGVALADKVTGEYQGVIASRPIDLGSRSVGEVLEDFSLIQPGGRGEERFEHIPPALYDLTGKGQVIGGLWVPPDAPGRAGIGGSALLSYLSRGLFASVLGLEQPDFFLILARDELVLGMGKGRSIIERHGFRYAARGPVWKNYRPGVDISLNASWAHKASIAQVMEETDWVRENAAIAKDSVEPEAESRYEPVMRTGP